MAPGWDTRYPPRGPLRAPGLLSSPASTQPALLGVLPALCAHWERWVRGLEERSTVATSPHNQIVMRTEGGHRRDKGTRK